MLKQQVASRELYPTNRLDSTHPRCYHSHCRPIPHLFFVSHNTVFSSLMASRLCFQGTSIPAAQHGQLLTNFGVCLRRKNVTNLWYCLFSHPVSTLLCPTRSHIFPVSSGFFAPCFSFQLKGVHFSPVVHWCPCPVA